MMASVIPNDYVVSGDERYPSGTTPTPKSTTGSITGIPLVAGKGIELEKLGKVNVGGWWLI